MSNKRLSEVAVLRQQSQKSSARDRRGAAFELDTYCTFIRELLMKKVRTREVSFAFTITGSTLTVSTPNATASIYGFDNPRLGFPCWTPYLPFSRSALAQAKAF